MVELNGEGGTEGGQGEAAEVEEGCEHGEAQEYDGGQAPAEMQEEETSNKISSRSFKNEPK